LNRHLEGHGKPKLTVNIVGRYEDKVFKKRPRTQQNCRELMPLSVSARSSSNRTRYFDRRTWFRPLPVFKYPFGTNPSK
jgi:hypothetical protein